MRSRTFILLFLALCAASAASAQGVLANWIKDNSTYTHVRNIRLPYDANIVKAIMQDRQGLMWIGTKRGLVCYNGYDTHLCYYGEGHPDGNVVQAIVQVSDTYLYIGTDGGLHKVNLNTWKIVPCEAELRAIKAVRSLALHDGKLWIGTRDDGLYRYDLGSHILDHPMPPGDGRQMVNAIATVGDKVFIGYYGGLHVYDCRAKSLRPIPLPHREATM